MENILWHILSIKMFIFLVETGALFQLFLGRPKFFFSFFNATGLLKNWKKQHFVCSNLTLRIVLFFLFSLFSFFLSLFSFFLSFFFLLGGGGGRRATAPSTPNDASGLKYGFRGCFYANFLGRSCVKYSFLSSFECYLSANIFIPWSVCHLSGRTSILIQ